MTIAQRAAALGRRRSTSGAAWGNNTHHQLGAGWGCSLMSQPVGMLLNDVVQMVSGYFATVALRTDGTVWSWGNGTLIARKEVLGTQTLPVEAELADVVAIAGVGDHVLALLENGEVRAWGTIKFGELGNGETSGDKSKGGQHEPQPVYTNASKEHHLTGIVAVAVGQFHCLAVTESGEVVAWGNNTNGQLGNGETEREELYPVHVKGLPETVTAVAGGGRDTSSVNGGHSLALLEGGTVMAWGYNEKGQLGNGTTEQATEPVAVKGLANVVAIAAAGQNSYALVKEGSTTKLMAWGGNETGQLGIGTSGEAVQKEPVEVKMPAGTVTYVSAGQANYVPFGNWCLAVCSGKAVSWGSNGSGQLGYETELGEYVQLGKKVKRMKPNPTPKEIPTPEGAGKVISVGAGEDHAVATLDGPGPSLMVTSSVVRSGTPEAIELTLNWEWDTEHEGKEWTFDVEVVHSHAELKKAHKEKHKFKKATLRTSLGARSFTIHSSEVPEWAPGHDFNAVLKLRPEHEEAVSWVAKGVSTAEAEEEEAPTVVTLSAAAVTETSAELRGTVESLESEVTECYFEYGTSEAFGSIIDVSSLPEGEGEVAVSAELTGLTPKTTYYFRLVAVSEGGQGEGEPVTFTTS